MTTPAIVCEDYGAIDSMSRSEELVSDNWWRVCGIMLLMGLLTWFATYLITLPIGFGFMTGSLRKMFDAQAAAGNGGTPKYDPSTYTGIFAGLAAKGLIQSFLQLLLTPLYTTVLYFDLRARRGDFPPEQEPQPAPTDPSRFQPPGYSGAPESDLSRFQPPLAQPQGDERFMPPPDPPPPEPPAAPMP